jgi:hypothetical protein
MLVGMLVGSLAWPQAASNRVATHRPRDPQRGSKLFICIVVHFLQGASIPSQAFFAQQLVGLIKDLSSAPRRSNRIRDRGTPAIHFVVGRIFEPIELGNGAFGDPEIKYAKATISVLKAVPTSHYAHAGTRYAVGLCATAPRVSAVRR